MKYNEITAVIDVLAMKRVRKKLREINVPGITVFQVQGYGAQKNFFRRDMMQQHSCLRIIAPKDETDHIVQTIIDTAHADLKGDGIVSVSQLDAYYSIRDKKRLDS
ncbi:MAG: P-II family nitrogen regulator [Robiginitomaculum sp.]|nr:P-II family nitrogen regulator [Robiginitomaculum sp.]